MNKGHTDSPSVRDVCSEGTLVETEALKKGPWTSAEDAILMDYVNKHGEGNWNAIQKYTGLSRCGKSCRLRWANHLRPDLKKGTFTTDEERRIVELHAKMGNKWARMAAELPGRTDNEIKNYWNTRIKRRQRAGLPIYPPDLCLQAMNESQLSQNIGINHADHLHADNFGIPDVEFKNLEFNQGVLSYLPTYFDVSASGMLTQGSSFQSHSFMYPTMHPPEVQQSETMFPGSNGCVSNILPKSSQYANDACERVVQPFMLSSPHEAGLNTIDSSSGIYSAFRARLDGNSSSSMPMSEAAKLELPSVQYSETQLGSWVSPSRLPSLESVDTFIQPPPTAQIQPQCLSLPNNGLLEAILYESQLKNSKKNLSHQSSSSSAVASDVDNSLLKISDKEWEDSYPSSSLSHSAASMFSEINPVSGSSPDEPQSVETMSGCKVELENGHSVLTQYNRKKEVLTRPDALLGSDWFVHGTEQAEDRLLLEDALAALQGENVRSKYKEMGALPITSHSQGCVRWFDTWDSVSSVSQTENH